MKDPSAKEPTPDHRQESHPEARANDRGMVDVQEVLNERDQLRQELQAVEHKRQALADALLEMLIVGGYGSVLYKEVRSRAHAALQGEHPNESLLREW